MIGFWLVGIETLLHPKRRVEWCTAKYFKGATITASNLNNTYEHMYGGEIDEEDNDDENDEEDSSDDSDDSDRRRRMERVAEIEG